MKDFLREDRNKQELFGSSRMQEAFHEMTPQAWHHPHMKEPTQECFSMLLTLSNLASPRSLFVVWILMSYCWPWLWYRSYRRLLQRAFNSGWYLVQRNIFTSWLPTRLATHLLTMLHLPHLHSRRSPDGKRCSVSMGKARRPRWTPGRAFQKSFLCLSPCPELEQK